MRLITSAVSIFHVSSAAFCLFVIPEGSRSYFQDGAAIISRAAGGGRHVWIMLFDWLMPELYH